MDQVTRILSAIDRGDAHAAEELLPLVYDELRKLAAQRLAHEKPGQTLQATALVHEAYLRLVEARSASKGSEESLAGAAGFQNRAHFFAAAAEAMRRILVDEARRKLSQKRGGERRRCELSEDDRIAVPLNEEIVDLDDALSKLAAADPDAAELVKLRVFGGMTIEEVAEVQGISARTVKRNWAYARAWLGRELAAYDEQQS
jgi:RNA polymerase sigma factor (TIGR02999 family)